MSLTLAQFNQVFPKIPEAAEIVGALAKVLPAFQINTDKRLAHFLAQVGHESGNFKFKAENLNYSADGLLKIFGKYFTPQLAAAYARQPQKIANRVYANRMGNGSEVSGDGWKFKGRGYIQLTGKDNYSKFSTEVFKDLRLLEDPSYLETVEGALQSACWYWNSRKLNQYADLNDIKTITKLINGGYIGLDHRTELLGKVTGALAGSPPAGIYKT